MMIDRSTSATLDRIFDEMYNLISEANRIPLTDKIIIEESDLAGILDDLKEAIPKEVKSATRLLEEQKAEKVIFLVRILQSKNLLLFVLVKLQIAGEGGLHQIRQILPLDFAGKNTHRDISLC